MGFVQPMGGRNSQLLLVRHFTWSSQLHSGPGSDVALGRQARLECIGLEVAGCIIDVLEFMNMRQRERIKEGKGAPIILVTSTVRQGTPDQQTWLACPR